MHDYKYLYFPNHYICNRVIIINSSHSGRAVLGVGLPVVCWDRGFESRLRHGCLSASFCVVLSCVGRGLATG
jgi:hypothetical protein